MSRVQKAPVPPRSMADSFNRGIGFWPPDGQSDSRAGSSQLPSETRYCTVLHRHDAQTILLEVAEHFFCHLQLPQMLRHSCILLWRVNSRPRSHDPPLPAPGELSLAALTQRVRHIQRAPNPLDTVTASIVALVFHTTGCDPMQKGHIHRRHQNALALRFPFLPPRNIRRSLHQILHDVNSSLDLVVTHHWSSRQRRLPRRTLSAVHI